MIVLSPDKKFPMKSPYLCIAESAMEAMRKLLGEFGLTPAARARVQVEKKFEGRPQAPVVPSQVEQVLLNLVINARQAMPRGGRLRLEVRENARTQMVEVRVADSGVGIPPDRLRLIFEPFYTTKEPDEHGHGGTGLGLSVCRQIIEQHQGRIRVESLVGKGSTFTVKLPLKVEPA